jgi:hypothetical protein
MTLPFPGAGPLDTEPEPRADIRAFTLAEHMIGEEYALLQIPEKDRTPAQRARLHELKEELDRLWHALRRRAETVGST